MAVIFDQAGGNLLDQASGQLLDEQSAPDVATLPVSGLTVDSSFRVTGATLNGTLSPYGTATWTFDWGLTVDYGNTVTGSASAPGAVSVTVAGLLAGQQYHYRLSAVNSLGTTDSADVVFTAAGLQPGPILPGVSPAAAGQQPGPILPGMSPARANRRTEA